MDENNRDWNLPIRILNETVKKLGLDRYIKEISNPDSWLFLRKLLYRKISIPQHWYVLHLINEEWREHSINKKAIPQRSHIGILLQECGLWEKSPLYKRWANILRLVIVRLSFRQMVWLGIRVFWKVVRVFRKEKVAGA